MLNDFEPLLRMLRGKRIAYLFNDRWGNWGDRWIDDGTRRMFGAAGLKYIPFAQSRWNSATAGVARDQCDVLALFGSGSVGRCCGEVARTRLRAARESKLPAVLLPSSTIDSLEDLSYCDAVYARESVSYEMLRHSHRSANLTPDLAMFGWLPDSRTEQRSGTFLRNDCSLPGNPKHDGDPALSARSMDDYLRRAGRCEVVETNRLHFALAAFRHGRKVIMRPCGWHKVKAYWSTWLATEPRVAWID